MPAPDKRKNRPPVEATQPIPKRLMGKRIVPAKKRKERSDAGKKRKPGQCLVVK